MCYPQNNKQDKIAKLNLAKQSGKHLPWHYKRETVYIKNRESNFANIIDRMGNDEFPYSYITFYSTLRHILHETFMMP